MVVVPPVSPLTKPVVETILATEGLELLHTPPGVELLSVVVLPWQAEGTPVMGEGIFTVTVVEFTQPAGVV
jgi:hypothetical protein